MLKKYVQRKLEKYVQKYFKRHPEVRLVVVAGSVGKTTTRNALATILSEKYRVRMPVKNYNTEISAPLAMLGIELPEKLHNPLSWLGVFRAAALRVAEPADVEVIVQELGVDHPDEMRQFARYLVPDIALVTAVTPEHMEFFKTLDAVAAEELSVTGFSKLTLINRDDIDAKYAELLTAANFMTYGTTGSAEYHFEMTELASETGITGLLTVPGANEPFGLSARVVGEHSMRPIVGAVAAALQLGLSIEEITRGVEKIDPVDGRMNPLRGIGDTIILDDTYNSSPAAAAAALQALYQFTDRAQRIAVLGSMNELGEVSAEEHTKLGQLCNPDLLAWVVIVGDDAAQYLAPAAKRNGCQVRVCRDAIEAGEFVRSVSEEGAVILVKGSQGGVYLEETVKILCEITEYGKLVRQSPEWLAIKQEHFSRFQDSTP